MTEVRRGPTPRGTSAYVRLSTRPVDPALAQGPGEPARGGGLGVLDLPPQRRARLVAVVDGTPAPCRSSPGSAATGSAPRA